MRNRTLLHKALLLLAVSFFTISNASAFKNITTLSTSETSDNYSIVIECDNLTNGGAISGDEVGQGNPTFDPSLITNTTLPSGGSGDIEYLWVYTTDDPTMSLAQWQPISGTNSSEYDPPVISQTTHFMRCARRYECIDYIAESNYVTKTLITCDNITDGGLVAINQSGDSPYDAETLINIVEPSGGSGAFEYLWFSSIVGPPYVQGSPNWTEIPNSNSPDYDPGILTDTTYFIRCVRRAGCTNYTGESNIITIIVNPDEETPDCEELLDGGVIAENQIGVSPYDANTLVNLSLPTGGNGEYEYLWFSSTVGPPYIEGSSNWTEIENSNSLNYDPGILTDTTYFIRLTRLVGCENYTGESNVITIIVNQNETPECDNVTDGGAMGFNQENCGAFDPNIIQNTVTPMGGTGDLEYLWFSSTITPIYIEGSPDWIAVPNSNTPDYDPELITETTYYIRCVRRTGCTEYFGESNIITLTVNPVPEIILDEVSSSICIEATTGFINITATGGIEPYTYEWDMGVGLVEDPTDLAAGLYTLTLTDANNCTAIQTVEINEYPALVAQIGLSNPTCPNGSDGSVTISVSGGNPPYTSVWNDVNMTEGITLSGIQAGTYTVITTDANGCILTNVLTLVDPEIDPTFTIETEIQNATCLGNSDGSVTVSVLEAGNYSYLWNDANSSMTSTLTNLSAATYTVLVTGETGCPQTQEVTIENSSTLILQLSSTEESCTGTMDGTATVEVQGGTAPYSVLWNDSYATTSPVLSNIGNGVYAVTVTDGNGCTASSEIQVNTGNGLTLGVTQQNISCAGLNDGFVIVMPLNGTAPYQYNWTNVNSDNGTASSLAPGTYTVVVSDANGCTGTASFELLSPTTITALLNAPDVNCATDVTNITASVEGGTPPYSYLWNTGATTDNLTSVGIGTYALTITDNNNCQEIVEVTIEFTSDFSSESFVTDISCFGANDGKTTITGSGGTTPYSVLWNTGATGITITDLSPDTYTATVTDADGCFDVETVEINEPTAIDLSLSTLSVVSDQGASNGAVTVSATGGASGFSYLWSNEAINQTITNLSAGTYTVTVTDAAGCSAIGEINLSDGLNLTVDVGNYVWYDSNIDGIQQPFEMGVGSVIVHLIDVATNTTVATQITNNLGFYIFEDVPVGNYVVEVDLTSLPFNTIISLQNVGNNDNVDSDIDPITGQTEMFTIVTGQDDVFTFDAGIRPKCINVTDGGTITANDSICPTEIPNLLTNLTLPSGGEGNLEYLWLQSTSPQYTGPGDPNWSPIPNSNAADYQPSYLTETTYFVRCSRRECCTEYPGESNIITVTVNYLPYVNILNAPNDACKNQTYDFEASAAGGSSVYLWDFGVDAIPQTSNLRETEDVLWTSAGEKEVTLTVTRDGCTLTVTTSVDVQDCPGFTGTFDNFSANLTGENTVALNWQTVTDDIGSIFFLEESRLGNEFVTIATISGHNNGSINTYEYVDENLFLGVNHYRVRQIFLGGSSRLSTIDWVNYIPQNSSEIRVFPNPFNNKFTVNVLLPQEETMLLRLMSPQGHILFEEELEAETYQRDFDLSAYPSGLYFVRVYYGYGGEVTEKIMKK